MAETNKDELTTLLQEIYDQAVLQGKRDDPTIVKLGAELEKRNPKPKAEVKPGQSPAKPGP
jgi:hypothetical protein